MSFRDAVRVMLGVTESADDPNEGRMDLQELGFDWLNTNDWVNVRIRAHRTGSLADAGPDLPSGAPIGAGANRHHLPSSGRGPQLAWLSDTVAEHTGAWYAAALRFADSGLWPIAVTGSEGTLDHPWRTGDLPGPQPRGQ